MYLSRCKFIGLDHSMGRIKFPFSSLFIESSGKKWEAHTVLLLTPYPAMGSKAHNATESCNWKLEHSTVIGQICSISNLRSSTYNFFLYC